MKKLTNAKWTNVVFVILCAISMSFLPVKAQFDPFPPANVDRTMDRDQMAWQLGITFPEQVSKLLDPNAPPGSEPKDENNPEGDWGDLLGTGNTITRSGWGLWNNYHDRWYGYHPGPDSAKVGDYPPIDLLKMKDSVYIISNEAEWWNIRRPEIEEDVREQMWGVIPHDSILPDITWSVVTTTGGSGASAYIQKVITGYIDSTRYPAVRNVPRISATLRVPANSAVPVPVMIVFWSGIDAYWNYAFPQGWGACAFTNDSLQPDNGGGLTSYIIGLCNKGNWRTPEQWGTLAAWSWGVSKLIDYFETDPLVDATKIGITGHSRYGKASIVAMAYEPRLFIAFPSDGGSLGPKMNRRHYGQNLENSVWDQEYHWMAGNFMKWGGERTPGQYLPRKIWDCPVDAHSLLSLCAPRPVFINGGTTSTWCDPYGMYLTTKEATPVYELLGVDGIIMNDPKPVVDKGYIEGTLAYRYHDGGHTDEPDWPAFWQFASKFVKMPTLFYTPGSTILPDSANSTGILVIISDTTWTLTNVQPWLTLNQTSGTHNDTVTYTLSENSGLTARQDTIKISAPGLKVMNVLINQKTSTPGIISLSDDTIDADITASSYVIDVTSNNVWNISNLGDWITAQPTVSLNDDSVTLTIPANSFSISRTQKVVFSTGDATDTLVVNQPKGAEPTLTIWTDFFVVGTTKTIGNTQGSTDFIWPLTNDPSATFFCSEDWLTLTTDPYNSEYLFHTLHFTATSANLIAEPREALITIQVTGLDPVIFTVIQSPADAYVAIDEDTLNIGAEVNSTVDLNLISNADWAISGPEWITSNPISGSYDTLVVTLTATANPTRSERTSEVIAIAGSVSDTVVVVQAGGPSTVEDINTETTEIYYLNGKLNVTFNKVKTEGTVNIFDLSGKRLKEWDFENTDRLSLSVSDLQSGAYIISVTTDESVIQKEFIK